MSLTDIQSESKHLRDYFGSFFLKFALKPLRFDLLFDLWDFKLKYYLKIIQMPVQYHHISMHDHFRRIKAKYEHI